MSDGSLVQRLQQDVADRQPVDWTALMSELQATEAASPDLLREVSLLQLLDEIGQAHATLQSESLGDDALPQGDAPADDTLKVWGRYVLEEKVGRGGFGSVYRAWDPVLEMAVALKILHQRYSDERLKERLLHEGRALAQLRHANVVRVLNVEQHGGRLGLVMEFLSGETMDALVAAHGKLSDREASVIVEDVCRALAAVHANGLIHRDVKARNIIREPAGRIVLMDFGAGLSMRTTEAPGTAVGTPLYMAPETLNGAPATAASDVYGVGVLLFYLVTGRYPYEGGSFDEIRDAHTARRANSLLGLRPDLPVRFVKVVERAVALDVAERYQTPDALLQALTGLGGAVSGGRWAWVRPAVYAGTALFALVLFGGILTTASFNATLHRSEFAQTSFLEWLEYGVRSLVLPLALALFGTSAVGLLVAVRKVLVPASVQFRRLDRYLVEHARAFAHRFGLTEPAVCACWLLVGTAVGAVSIWAAWGDVWQAITSDISRAPAETLALLSPPFTNSMTHQRMLLSLLTAGAVTAWYALARFTKAHGGRLPTWFTAAELALLVLLYGSWQLPYRIARDSNKFPSATWGDQRCFILGQRGHERLLFCPQMMPRTQVVAADRLHDFVKAGDSLFASFAPP